MSNPLLSLVAVGRNDDYGGDFKQRLQNYVNWSIELLTRYEISSEFIFVNYNPIDGEPIEKFIVWPESNSFVKIRVITVPKDEHVRTVSTNGVKDVPVLEYVAKNVGIRRAKGKFVLSMNPDILLDEGIVKRFNQLSAEHYYRSNRVDYVHADEIDSGVSLYDQLRENVTTIWFKGNHCKVSGLSYRKYETKRFLNRISNLWKRNTVHLEWILKRVNITTYH
ncbi:MAG: hypothetical protein ACPGD8_09060, partial [Flavobacteriales bacterium]